MPRASYRGLRIMLGFLSVFVGVGGLVMIVGGQPLMVRLFLRPPESEVSTLLLVMMKEMGGLFLMFSLLLYFASRDPIRNVAIVNAFIVGLCVLALTPLLSLYILELRRLYPAYLIWGRSAVRLALAGLLYLLATTGGPISAELESRLPVRRSTLLHGLV
jgi:hypothetical protein